MQAKNQWSVPAILLFAKNADNENEKCLKIKVFICISHSKLKKGYPFFNFHSPLRKPKKSAPFPHEKPDVFRICLRHKVNQLSSVIFISHESRKSWKETFLEFFQLFAFFFKVKKSRLFPGPFLCLVFLAECTRLTAVKKGREILGNPGINLQVFICSCTLCVPAMFQDVGSLRQNLDGQEIKKG